MVATLGQVTAASPREQEAPGPWGLSKHVDVGTPSDEFL